MSFFTFHPLRHTSIHMHPHTYIYTRIHMHTRKDACVCVRINTHTQTHKDAHIHRHRHTDACVHTHAGLQFELWAILKHYMESGAETVWNGYDGGSWHIMSVPVAGPSCMLVVNQREKNNYIFSVSKYRSWSKRQKPCLTFEQNWDYEAADRWV